MAATCAACSRPIATGERFVLSGTEVVHRRSACVAGLARSALTRAKAELMAMRIELEQANRESLSLRRDAADARIALQNLETEYETSRRSLLKAENARVGERGKIAEERRARELAEQQLDALSGRFRQTQNELAAARAEIAKLQADAIRRATDDLPVPDEHETRDATEIRFSLLEIDEP